MLLIALALVASASALQRPRSARRLDMSAMAAFQKSAATIADYDAIAAAFDAGNKDHDVSQNIDALLVPLERAQPGAKLTVVDLGCAGGRDLVTFLARGCDAWGVEGSAAFCELARRAAPAATVLEQDLCDLRLPPETFDGVIANASIFHVPREHLAELLSRIRACLKPGGRFFCSNAHGFGEDKEGWTQGRTPSTRSWVCWLSEASWNAACEAAGFTLADSYYRGSSKAFLATVWAKPRAS